MNSPAAQTTPSASQPRKKAPSPVIYGFLRRIETTSSEQSFDLKIECSKPVVPSFTRLKDPERIVIDLPNTILTGQKNVITDERHDVQAVRVQQFTAKPPVTRVVLDLAGSREYSFEPANNILTVHVKRAGPIAKQPPQGTYTIGLPTSNPDQGSIVPAGAKLSRGSTVTAGADTAVVNLARGGQVRVCPGTTVSVTPSPTGSEMMLGMSSGGVELHYKLDSFSDTVLTPDFRMLLTGPADFEFAISADTKGNTCVRALTGNSGTVLVSELMGDRAYEVKPLEQVVFHAGRLVQTDANVPLECGCPPARPAQLTAAVAAVPGQFQAVTAPKDKLVPAPPAEQEVPRTNPPVIAEVRPTDPAPQETDKSVRVQVDAPFVFRANEPSDVSKDAAALTPENKPPSMGVPAVAPSEKLTAQKKEPGKSKKKSPVVAEKQQTITISNAQEPAKAAVQRSARPEQPKQKTFFGAVKSFFRALFR